MPPPTPPQQQQKNQRSKRSSRSAREWLARKQIDDDPGKGLWVANHWESSFSTALILKPIQSSKSDETVSGLEIWIVTIRGSLGRYMSLSSWILRVGTRWRNSNSAVVVFGGFRFKREREIEWIRLRNGKGKLIVGGEDRLREGEDRLCLAWGRWWSSVWVSLESTCCCEECVWEKLKESNVRNVNGLKWKWKRKIFYALGPLFYGQHWKYFQFDPIFSNNQTHTFTEKHFRNWFEAKKNGPLVFDVSGLNSTSSPHPLSIS